MGMNDFPFDIMDIGNLAIVCAQRPELLMMVHDGAVTVFLGAGPTRKALSAGWNDDAEISRMIAALNFGAYALDRAYAPAHKEAA